jgi:hypothetical protein
MAGGSEGEAFFVVLERERDGCFLPHKKRVQGRTEAAMEREKGGVPRPWGRGGKSIAGARAHTAFFFPSQTNKQTQKNSDHQTPAKNKRRKSDAVFSYNIHTPT